MNLINRMLAAHVAVLALWAVGVQAATNDDIAARIKPVGEVCIQGQECKGVQAVAAAAGAGGGKTPDSIISAHCNVCHASGLLGAPKIGDNAAWKERADHQGGLDGLLEKAISGINAMPPKGTCADCSDDELLAAIKQMSGL